MREKRNVAFSVLVAVLAVAMVMVMAISAYAETPSPKTTPQRIYLKIGGDPKDPSRQLLPDEEIMASTQDFWVVTNGKHRVYRGWVPAGTEFVTSPTNDPTLRKSVWIKKCGNDVLNPEDKAIYFRVQADVPAGRQISGAELSSNAKFEPEPIIARASARPTTEKKCFGKGTWMTGAGTLLTGVGVGIGHWGYLLTVPGLALTYFGAKDEASDPACKAVAAVVGGIGGYAAGHAYKVNHQGGEPSSSFGPSPPPPGNN